MQIIRLFGSLVEVDERSTKAWYANKEEWDCDCGDCRNFLNIAKDRKLPVAILEVLDQLGIAPEQATYVCSLVTEGDYILYQCSYRIAGSILEEKKDGFMTYEWGEAGCTHEIYPYGAPGFPEPHFDLEFFVKLPCLVVDRKL